MQIEATWKGTGTEEQVMVNIDADLLTKAEQVANAGHGRFAVISEHVSFGKKEKCIVPCVSDILMVSRPRYDNYLRRKVEKLSGLDFLRDVAASLSESKVGRKFIAKCEEKGVETEDTFNERKARMVAKAQETLAGERDDGWTRGHDRCYVHYKGVKLHLLTEAGKDKLMHPVEDEQGTMTVVSVMLPWFQVGRDKTPKEGHSHCKGEWKETNSGPAVLAEAVIKQAVNLPEWKTFSLGLENYHKLAIDHQSIMGVILADDHKISQEDLRAVSGVGYEEAEAQNAESEEQAS